MCYHGNDKTWTHPASDPRVASRFVFSTGTSVSRSVSTTCREWRAANTEQKCSHIQRILQPKKDITGKRHYDLSDGRKREPQQSPSTKTMGDLITPETHHPHGQWACSESFFCFPDDTQKKKKAIRRAPSSPLLAANRPQKPLPAPISTSTPRHIQGAGVREDSGSKQWSTGRRDSGRQSIQMTTQAMFRGPPTTRKLQSHTITYGRSTIPHLGTHSK